MAVFIIMIAIIKQCKIATSYCINGICVYEASQASLTTDSCVSLLLACFSIGFKVGGYGLVSLILRQMLCIVGDGPRAS